MSRGLGDVYKRQNMGLKFASPEQLAGIDIPALIEAIKQGATGKIVEVQSEEVTVEITVE